MVQENSKQIAIDDIKLSAYLHAKQIPILKIEKSGRYGCFYFPEAKARDEIDRYVMGNALVEPKKYSASIRELRAAVENIDEKNYKESTTSVNGVI